MRGKRPGYGFLIVVGLGCLGIGPEDPKVSPSKSTKPIAKAAPVVRDDSYRRVVRSEREWQKRLTRSQFEVCRMKATEIAFSGPFVNFHGEGIFRCVACDAPLFSSVAKFDSGTGWPSFWSPIASKRIHTGLDTSEVEPRVEVTCAACDSHLGHVFNDGPAPTGLRYCINSVSLRFVDINEMKAAEEAAKKPVEVVEATEKFVVPPGEKRLEFK